MMYKLFFLSAHREWRWFLYPFDIDDNYFSSTALAHFYWMYNVRFFIILFFIEHCVFRYWAHLSFSPTLRWLRYTRSCCSIDMIYSSSSLEISSSSFLGLSFTFNMNRFGHLWFFSVPVTVALRLNWWVFWDTTRYPFSHRRSSLGRSLRDRPSI